MTRDDQGVGSKKYRVIPRTLIFIFNQENQVLLLKGAAEKRLWAGLYNGIGGHVKAGEDILESAQRELFEESGIQGVHLDYCGQIMIDVESDVGISVFLFRGIYEGLILKASIEGDLAWLDLDEITNFPLVEDLPLLIPKIFSYQPGDAFLIGKYAYTQEGDLEISFR